MTALSAFFRQYSVNSRTVLRVVPLLLIALAAACSEQLDSSDNCPILCSPNAVVFKDTVLDVIEFDSAYGGFTGEGERWPAPALATTNGNAFLYDTYVALANRPDSVDIRQVFRFDSLPNTLSFTDTTTITALQSSRFLFVVDTSRSLLPAGDMTVNLYDVADTTVANDTSVSLLAARFRPERLIASRTFTREQLYADTIIGVGSFSNIRAFSVSVNDSVLLRYVRGPRRLRVGMQLVSPTSAILRIVAPSTQSAGLVPRLSYDPSPDTLIVAREVATLYSSATVVAPERFRAQALVLRDRTPLRTDGSLQVGGLVASRTLLRVRVPRSLLDTVTIIRATLDMTMLPQPTVPGATTRVRVRPRISIAGPALQSEPRRFVEVLDPTLEGATLSALRIAPADTGVKSFDVGNAIRFWVASDTTRATALVLYSEGEVFQEQRPAFYSRRSSNPALRPRLRVTYTTRREAAIP
jgi:hypothetical protein